MPLGDGGFQLGGHLLDDLDDLDDLGGFCHRGLRVVDEPELDRVGRLARAQLMRGSAGVATTVSESSQWSLCRAPGPVPAAPFGSTAVRAPDAGLADQSQRRLKGSPRGSPGTIVRKPSGDEAKG